MASPAVLALIADRAEIPYDSIEAQGPYDLNLPVINQEPTAERRSTQIVGEGALYRLRFENNPTLPIVSVFSQAPTQAEAMALAKAAPAALRAYVDRIQVKQHTPDNLRVEIRTLGKSSGGVVNAGANIQIATVVFVAVFVGWCMLLIPAHTIARGWRETGGWRDSGPVDNSSASGNGSDMNDGAVLAARDQDRVL
jgi:hypothetical protein